VAALHRQIADLQGAATSTPDACHDEPRRTSMER
jgi:hypothetical protein